MSFAGIHGQKNFAKEFAAKLKILSKICCLKATHWGKTYFFSTNYLRLHRNLGQKRKRCNSVKLKENVSIKVGQSEIHINHKSKKKSTLFSCCDNRCLELRLFLRQKLGQQEDSKADLYPAKHCLMSGALSIAHAS